MNCAQKINNQQINAIELSEQELESVTGGCHQDHDHGRDDRRRDDDDHKYYCQRHHRYDQCHKHHG